MKEAAQIFAAGLAIVAMTALAHPAWSPLVAIDFGLSTGDEVGPPLEFAGTNARLAAAALVAAFALTKERDLWPLTDIVLVPLFALNTIVVGVAIADHGAALTRAIALHGTVELAGFAAAGGAYVRAHRGLGPRFAASAAASAALLGTAACLEAWVTL